MTTPTQWPDWTPDQPGDEPPPPPPGSAGDPAPGWGAPPEPSRGRGLLVVAIVAALLIGTGLLGGAAYVVSRAGDDPVVAQPDDPAPSASDTDDATDGPTADTGDDPIDPSDFDRPTDVVTAELLETIDASELAMIQFQIGSRDGVDQDGNLLDGGESLVVDAASAGVATLDDLAGRLAAIEPGGSGAVTDGHLAIRDRYGEHLQAWRDWMDAVAADPSLLQSGNTDAEPFSRDIETTAEDFVAELEVGLPAGTPAQLRAFADFILERGFGGPSAPGGELA